MTIDRFISGESSASILVDTGIHKSTFYSWLLYGHKEQKTDIRKK